jgi:ABC-type sugar transport system ATPase subunit
MSAANSVDYAGPVLEVRGVSKVFPGVQALDNVDVQIYPGEVHTILGENGAGKSTLLKIIFGALPADAGEILIDQKPMRFEAPVDASNAGVAMVHQELSLIPQMNAVQNIVLGRERVRAGIIDWSEARRRAKSALAMLDFGVPMNVPVSTLSIAHQQLIEIARALSVDARIIIFDEPTASLTKQESDQLFSIITGLRRSGKAIVYVSHRLKEVLDLSDRITVLRDGKLVSSVRRDEVTGEPDLVRLMVGRDLSALGVPPSGIAPGPEALRVEGLSVPGVLEKISLVIRRGEIVGMAGMIGAGRTEFARAVIGADKASEGTTYINGEQVLLTCPRDAIEAGIAYLPEDRKRQGLIMDMTTASNVTLMSPPNRYGVVDRTRQRSVAEEVLMPLNAKLTVGMTARQLSGGTQQKLVLAKWLLAKSDVFIFDEPTRGIDVGAKGEIHALMRKLADSGKAILMISSDLPEVLAMSDRILIMRRGRLVAELNRDEATEEKVVLHAAAD